MKERGVGVGKGVMEDVRLKPRGSACALESLHRARALGCVQEPDTRSGYHLSGLYASLKAETGFYSSWCSLSRVPHKGHERG